MGKWINWKNPLTYNEKLQWLKIYNRNPQYTVLVDKYAVKPVVANIIGRDYIVPTIASWDNPNDIDFDLLPKEFVLKTTNGGGGSGVIICRDKQNLDIVESKRKLSQSLKSNIYTRYKEWPYKNIYPRIIAEPRLTPTTSAELNDYKFYCFNGEPKIMLISHGRFHGTTCFDYYDMDFRHLPFEQGGPNAKIEASKPKNFDLMKRLAAELSSGIPHVRVDLYNCDGKVYFGELTFFDSSGFAEFNPQEWDEIFGQWINLPDKLLDKR